jgi:hypothetical protein
MSTKANDWLSERGGRSNRVAFPLASGIGIGIGIPRPRTEFKALAMAPCEWINEDMISDVMYMIWDWDMDISGHNFHIAR